MNVNVVICGIGGQGNILASGLMGSALVEKGYKVSVGETYGASQRGGSVMSHLRVSDERERGVLIPHGQADIVVAFEPVEALRILRVYGNENTKVIYDTRPAYPLGVLIGEDEYPALEDIAAEITASCAESYPLPATEMAVEAGNAKVANIIMMGALAAMDEMPIEPEEFYKALEQNFKGKVLDMNKEVFMTGYDAIKERRGK
ncbi:MAG: indolepyruvate oxidoreductase subunit beta [Firmicutes bacterium]|nr:indolepyruvate oxidoreductase subunit beta [Bacillota bacterium]